MATGGFLLVCLIIFAQSSSELKDFSDAVPKTILNKNLDLGSIINKTNSTIFPYFTTIFAYNKNVTTNKIQPLTDLENELEINNQLKGKRCTKNFTKCMNEDPDYEPTLRHLTNFLYSNSPPFDLSNVEGVSEECKRASQRYMSDLKQYQMWALRMYDAAAKIPSGFLSGNTNQLGDFDLCLSANSEENQIYGKYCLAAVQIETPHNPYLSAIHNKLYAHQSFKSKLGDPGHRVPRFSSINWALCVPDQCSGKDVELGFRRVVDKILSKTDLEYKMEVDSNMCSTSRPTKSLNYHFIFGSLFFILAFLIAVSATLYDYFYENEIKNEWIMAFSLRRNILSVTSIKREQNDLEAVHGIRFINAVGLLLSHKSMALLFLPYVNRTQMSEIIGQPWTVIGRAASLYTDPFIMISGTLTAYSLFGRLQKNLKISILQEYTSRLLRILPTLSALILFCTFVLPYLNAGPMWNLVITHHSDICQKYWWRNLLFIHNYFGFKDMCLTHTHHVGIDTQLFFASPFFVLLVWKWPRRGTFTLITLATISTVMRYYVTYTRKLSNYVHFGTSVEQLFNTADYMYILPAHRVTVYIMGIFLGYILRNCKNVILKPIHINIGHVIAIACFIASFIGPSFMGNINYVYKPVHAAWYAAFAPILWCWSFAWIIFTCHIGYKSLIGKIFCFPYFKLWTKISYTVYLTQFPIFFYNVGTTRHSEYYDFIPKNVNVLETMSIFGISALLTLLFESPFLNMKNIMFRRKPISAKPQELEKKIS